LQTAPSLSSFSTSYTNGSLKLPTTTTAGEVYTQWLTYIQARQQQQACLTPFAADYHPLFSRMPHATTDTPLPVMSVRPAPGIVNAAAHILRSHTSSAQHKAIPCVNDGVPFDLDRFRHITPCEWSFDDVTAWMIGVARKHRVPLEEMNMTRFSGYTGAHLALMTRAQFDEKDHSYGSLLYAEFRAMLGELASICSKNMFTGDDNNFVDEWFQRLYREEVELRKINSTTGMLNNNQHGQQLKARLALLNAVHNTHAATSSTQRPDTASMQQFFAAATAAAAQAAAVGSTCASSHNPDMAGSSKAQSSRMSINSAYAHDDAIKGTPFTSNGHSSKMASLDDDAQQVNRVRKRMQREWLSITMYVKHQINCRFKRQQTVGIHPRRPEGPDHVSIDCALGRRCAGRVPHCGIGETCQTMG
jgi:hypothetical protein